MGGLLLQPFGLGGDCIFDDALIGALRTRHARQIQIALPRLQAAVESGLAVVAHHEEQEERDPRQERDVEDRLERNRGIEVCDSDNEELQQQEEQDPAAPLGKVSKDHRLCVLFSGDVALADLGLNLAAEADLFELLAQPVHVDRQRIVADESLVVPEALDDVFSADDPILLLDQQLQDIEFILRQLDRAGVVRDGILLVVDGRAAPGLQRDRFRVVIVDAPQNRLHLRDEHLEVERLLDEVVRSELHRHHHVGRMVARRQEEDRHVRAGPDHAAPVEPVETGQLDIDDDEIRLDCREFLDHLREVLDAVHVVRPVGEPVLDLGEQGRIVFDEQDFEQLGSPRLLRCM